MVPDFWRFFVNFGHFRSSPNNVSYLKMFARPLSIRCTKRRTVVVRSLRSRAKRTWKYRFLSIKWWLMRKCDLGWPWNFLLTLYGGRSSTNPNYKQSVSQSPRLLASNHKHIWWRINETYFCKDTNCIGCIVNKTNH